MKLRCVVGGLLGLAIFATAHGEEYEWKTECVGLLALDLPGNAVIAGISQKDLRGEILTPSQDRSYRFPEGQLAPWVRVLYKGELLISNQLDGTQKELISTDFDNAKELVGERLKGSASDPKPIRNIAELPPATKAWATKSAVRMLVDLGEYLLFTRISEQGGEAVAVEEARALAANISYRPIFNVPRSPGICIPHAYVKDGDSVIRNVGSAYRLMDHPDITVYLRDANAAHYEESVRERNAAPRRLNESFWAQYQSNRSVKRISSISKTRADFALLKGWRTGFASVATIERKDGSIDWGYFAALRGDPQEPKSLDMELIVMQDSSNARNRGIAPLTRDQFMTVVSKLSDTVRYRSNL